MQSTCCLFFISYLTVWFFPELGGSDLWISTSFPTLLFSLRLYPMGFFQAGHKRDESLLSWNVGLQVCFFVLFPSFIILSTCSSLFTSIRSRWELSLLGPHSQVPAIREGWCTLTTSVILLLVSPFLGSSDIPLLQNNLILWALGFNFLFSLSVFKKLI